MQTCVIVHYLPEGHLEYLSQVDLLGFVVVSMQHLTKQGVIEVDIMPRAFWPLTVVWLQEAGAAISCQFVLLHTPGEEKRAVNIMYNIYRLWGFFPAGVDKILDVVAGTNIRRGKNLDDWHCEETYKHKQNGLSLH